MNRYWMLMAGLSSVIERATMIDRLKREFGIGFAEGWESFWSPFTALYSAISEAWNRHVKQGE
jgi:hypothetical protein